MPLEQANTINELNATYPLANDPATQGDDHIRNIKKTVKATFPNITGVMTTSHTDLNKVSVALTDIQDLKDDKANKSITITAGTGLTGTGTLAAGITLNVGAANGITVAADTVGVNAGSGLVANSTGLHIGAGPGLSINADQLWVGTGDGITADPTAIHVDAKSGLVANSNGLYVGAGSGISVSNTAVSVDNTVLRTTGAQSRTGILTFTANSYPDIRGTNSYIFGRTDAGVNKYSIYSPDGDAITYLRSFAADGATWKNFSFNGTNGNLTAASFTGNGSDLTSLNASQLTTGTVPDARLATNIVRTTRSITTTNGITGGGDLTGNRVLSIVAGNGLRANSSGVHVQTGDGMTQNSTHVYVVAGSGITATSSGVAVDSTVVRTSGAQSISGRINGNSFYATSPSGGAFIGNVGDSANNVSFGWLSDLNTGMWRVASNRIGFSTGGTNRVVIDSNGLSVTSGNIDGNGSGLTNLNASRLTTGDVPEARLTKVGLATANYVAGDIGTYALLEYQGSGTFNPNVTQAGSNLRYATAAGWISGVIPTGTWRLMGYIYTPEGDENNVSLWLRIS